MKNFFKIFILIYLFVIITTCKKDKPTEEEKLAQLEQKIIDKIDGFMPVQVGSMFGNYFNINRGQKDYSLYLDSIATAIDELKAAIQLNFSLDDYKKTFNNSLTTLESPSKGSTTNCLGLGYAKGGSLDAGLAGEVGLGISAGVKALGGGGIKTIYDFVNHERQIYIYSFCGLGAVYGTGVGAVLKGGLGFSGINEIITGIRYRGNKVGLNAFQGQAIGHSFSLSPNICAAFGEGLSIGVSVGIGTSVGAIADFSALDDLTFCPEYKVEIENGTTSYSFKVNGTISGVLGYGAIVDLLSLNTTMTNSIGRAETYTNFSNNRALAGLKMAKEICLPGPYDFLLAIPGPSDLAASTIAIIYSFKDFSSCPAEIPAIGTKPISSLTSSSAICGGIVKDDRGASVISRGVVWSTSENPTIASTTVDGQGIGEFTSNISNLTSNTTYYVRAYATNSAGTGYGDQVSFTTSNTVDNNIVFNPNLTYGSLSDIEGNTYKTIQIGTQTWMAENLKTTKYLNGETIGTTTTNITIFNSPKFQWPYGNESNVSIYGRLYTWYAATDSRNVCPLGWHVPSTEDWNTLTLFLGGEAVAGDKMKETGTAHWKSPNDAATNESGFTALPGGYRFSMGLFFDIGNECEFWSSSEFDSATAWSLNISYNYSHASSFYYDKGFGYSIRCLKDN